MPTLPREDPSIRRVSLRTTSRTYDALIASSLLDRAGPLIRAAVPTASACAIIVDDAVRSSALPRLERSLADAGLTTFACPLIPSEPDKSLATLDAVLSAVAARRLERGNVVIALGGGIVGDISGFAAASYRRGVPWVNCPTTLLAMVDASVGGKTGVNIHADGALKKNMAGAFWQPTLVLADTRTLTTLPERAFRAGLAECVKHALLAGDFADPDLFEWTERNRHAIGAREPQVLQDLIARNIAVKARVVETDEREELPDAHGGRALLNLGHTFAHAIETIPHLSPTSRATEAPLQHGEAVSLGVLAATRLAASLGLVPSDLPDRVEHLLAEFGLPIRVAGLPPTEQIIARMRDDKKVLAGRLRLILPSSLEAPWRCVVRADTDLFRVGAAIDSIRA